VARTVAMLCIAITAVCVTLVPGAWPAGLPDISQQLKALQPGTDYKITDIVGKKMTVSDPMGAPTTLEGVNTEGFKVGDVLKGSDLREKLMGQIPSLGKGAIPRSIPTPSSK
jgi:hypothetical protein